MFAKSFFYHVKENMNTLSYRAAETNKTLRNTFILVALSLIPTVFGVYGAMALGLPAIMSTSPWLTLGGFLLLAFGLIAAIHSMSHSGTVFIPLTGLALLMGAMLSTSIQSVLGFSNGADLIAMAFGGTVVILLGCGSYAATTKRDFSSLGGFLFGSLLAVIAVGVANMFLQIPVLGLVLSFAVLALFSAYLVYDIQRIVQGGETNYVIAAVSVYLNLINIFSSLLNILSIFGNSDD